MSYFTSFKWDFYEFSYEIEEGENKYITVLKLGRLWLKKYGIDIEDNDPDVVTEAYVDPDLIEDSSDITESSSSEAV